MKKPTIKDVAKRAGVAISTVSNVINNSKYVSPETREKVEAVLAESNYSPNIIAQSFRKNKDNTIGIVVPFSNQDMANMYFISTVFGIEETLRAKYHLIFSATHESHADEISQVELFSRKRISGLILAPSSSDISYLKEYFDENFPVAVIDRRAHGFGADEIVVNGDSAIRSSIHKMKTRGCSRIGYISGPLDISSAIERHGSYEQALADHNLKYDASLVRTASPTFEQGYRLTAQLYRDVDALFLANNVMAMGAIRLLNEKQVKIPDSMKVVVYDDFDWVQITNPPLTAVRQPARKMGSTAAQLLIDRIAAPTTAPMRIELQAKLVERGSL